MAAPSPVLVLLVAALAPLLAFYAGSFFSRHTDTARGALPSHSPAAMRKLYLLVSAGAAISVFGALAACVLTARSAQPQLLSLWSILPGLHGAGYAAGYGDILGITLLLDRVSAVMLLLISTIAFVTIRFSERYLEGEVRQVVFLKWLALTSSFAQLLPLSGNLSMLLVVWLMVSLSLHRLLTYYSERPLAQRCARHKFFISRFGDLALITASVIVATELHTLDFIGMSAAIDLRATSAVSSGSHFLVSDPLFLLMGVLLALGALAKSAQLPFHAWLPQSLETPTPVSALMHAGIINAGGLLLIRCSSLIQSNTVASTLLVIVGGCTALYGMSVMVTQTSIKKRLAYSTVGQMGFMIVQCGLGLYALALLHIVAHGFYKAYAFLRAGSAMDQAREQLFFPERHMHSLRNAVIYVALLTVAALFLVYQLSTHFVSSELARSVATSPNHIPILVVWVLAVSHLMWGAVSVKQRTALSVAVGALFAAALVALYTTLAVLFERYLAPAQTTEFSTALAAAGGGIPVWAIIFVSTLFGLGFCLQMLGKSLVRTEFGARLHLHLHNGLYFEMLYRRLFDRSESNREKFSAAPRKPSHHADQHQSGHPQFS